MPDEPQAAQTAPQNLVSACRTWLTGFFTRTKEIVTGLDATRDERVAQQFAQEEDEKRVKLIVGGIKLIEKLQLEVRKIKPDLIAKDHTGAQISANFSSAEYEKLKKAKEVLEKAERAFEKAQQRHDYNDLANLVGGGGNKSDS